MNYPNKPWSDGQTAELVAGETYIYDAVNAVWNHVTKATLDSDYQIDKTAFEAADSDLDVRVTTIEGEIDTLQSEMSTAQSDITALQADVIALGSLTDSDAARITQNVQAINTAYSMLDSDSINIQALRSDLDAEIAATNSDVSGLDSRLTTAENDIDENTANIVNLDSDVGALAMPVISSTQPAGKPGLLWVNLTDGKLYFWNTSTEVFTEISTT